MNDSQINNNENGLEICNIKKRFPGVTALDNVSFTINQGEIHSIVGENGAGKSTLMNIISGLLIPDEGNIFLNGKELPLGESQKIINMGIDMVHQHFMLVPTQTALQNIILGREPKNGIFIDYDKAYREVENLMEKYNLNVDLSNKVKNLPVSSQQRVEILKILYKKANFIILDEPTAVLTPIEIENFLKNIKNLSKQGKTIIFISHKLKEVLKVSDKITVLRNGKLVSNRLPEDTDEEELAKFMVGEHISLNDEINDCKNKKNQDMRKILEINNVTTKKTESNYCSDINFDIQTGRIYGLVGVEGSGQEKIVKAILGLTDIENGKIIYEEESINENTTREIRDKGILCIAGDRKKEGLIVNFNLINNVLLGFHRDSYFKQNIFINWELLSEKTSELIEEFNIKTPSKKFPVRLLSGGNQQKLVLARECAIEKPKILIAIQPTRGLDIKSVNFIHKYLKQLKKEGVAVLLVSKELEEVIKLSDEIFVFHNGELIKQMNDTQVSKKQIGLFMGGGK